MTIATWVHAARPITLVASIIPIISAMLILPTTTFKINIFSWTLIAAIIIQIVTNYINDLFDFLKFGFLFSLKASRPSCASSVI